MKFAKLVLPKIKSIGLGIELLHDIIEEFKDYPEYRFSLVKNLFLPRIDGIKCEYNGVVICEICITNKYIMIFMTSDDSIIKYPIDYPNSIDLLYSEVKKIKY